MFLSLVLSGEADDTEDDSYIRRLSTSICQDLVYGLIKGKCLTPKHLGLGFAVHQATRSKRLVNLIHSAGHCASYYQLLRVDTALAQHTIEKYRINDNTIIPSNLTKNQFFQFAADNIDIIEETLDGTGTFHATQMVVHQRGISDKHHHDIPIAKDTSFKIPEEFNKIDPAPFHRGRTSPVLNKELNHEWFNPDVKQAELANIKDIIWILTKLHDPEHNVP
ncbi:uncharacterized protein LOC117102801 isoform X1 [Anneissia japonica]|uniref:uncharacterized protein LOC117102801 isoform X1 n=1 Tax=Anneissia japonica TaxID=1529436 RepID=UPI0014255B16|nr:uncharacterized protein LOC117102801 isoform X1 [Anneissia japonica]